MNKLMPVTVRLVQKPDINDIYKLGRSTKELWVSPETKFYTKKELYNWMERPKENIFLVATCKNKVVGFSFTKIMSVEWAMGDTMAIRPQYRNQGIGTLLHNKRVVLLKKRGINFISGLVDINSPRSIGFWKKNGYKLGKKLFWMGLDI